MKGVQRLEDWMTISEAGKYLGISRQQFHTLVFETQLFHVEDLRMVGEKPLYLVRTASVVLLKQMRKSSEDAKRDMRTLLEELTMEN